MTDHTKAEDGAPDPDGSDAPGASGAADTTAAETGAPAPEAQSPGEWAWATLRRLTRSRVAQAVTAAGLVGVLLGAGTVAWRTDTLPLLSPDPCWDTFDGDLVTQVFGDRGTVAETQRLQTDPNSRVASYGQCRITSYEDGEKERAVRQLTVQVHTLSRHGARDGRVWPGEFLASDMVPLGEGLPGMVSPSRAWLALPESCTGEPGILSTHTVVDLAMGDVTDGDIAPKRAPQARAALSDAVVAVTNGVLRELGCSGTYTAPAPEQLGELVGWQDTEPDAFCGIKGLRLPAAYRDALNRVRAGGGSGPARTCEATRNSRSGDVRLTTVVDSGVARVFAEDATHDGTPLRSPKGDTPGWGSVGVTRGMYVAQCQAGDVAFVVEQVKSVISGGEGPNLVRALLPKYVEAEAERIGCGPIRLKLPEVLE